MKEKAKKGPTAELNRTLRGASPRERLLHRLHSVALVLHGMSASEAGRIYGDSARSVAYWVKPFRQDGVQGIEEGSRPGRPSKLSPAQLQELQAFVSRCRGVKQAISGAVLVSHILHEFGVKITRRQGVRLFTQIRWCRPCSRMSCRRGEPRRAPIRIAPKPAVTCFFPQCSAKNPMNSIRHFA